MAAEALPSEPSREQIRAWCAATARALVPALLGGAAERDRERRVPYAELDLIRARGLEAILVPRRYGGIGGEYSDQARVVSIPMLVMLGDRGPLGSKSSYGSGWQLSQECRPDTELSIVEGGTGTYYIVDAADRAAEQAMAFFARHSIAAA